MACNDQPYLTRPSINRGELRIMKLERSWRNTQDSEERKKIVEEIKELRIKQNSPKEPINERS